MEHIRTWLTSMPPRRYAAIGALVLLYSLLYLRGLAFGKPLRQHPDEWRVTTQAMVMLAEKDLCPPLYYGYGTLSLYLQVPVCAAVHAVNQATGAYCDAQGNPVQRSLAEIAADDGGRGLFPFFWAGRLSSAIYAGIMFILLYRLSLRLFKVPWLALFTVAAAMLHPLAVCQGHLSLPNTLAVTLGVAAMLLAITFLQEGRTRSLYAAAAVAGLAIAAKASMLPILLAVLASAALGRRPGTLKHLPALPFVAVAAFIAVTPPAVLEVERFAAQTAREVEVFHSGELVDDTMTRPERFGGSTLLDMARKHPLLYPLLYWWSTGKLFFLCSAIGLLLLPFLCGKAGIILLLFGFTYLYWSGMHSTVFLRHYLPLTPVWALAVGAAFAGLHRAAGGVTSRIGMGTARARTAVIAASLCGLAIIALGPAARESWATTAQFTRRGPQQTALAWIQANVPKGASITTERLWLPVQIPFSDGPYNVTIHEKSIFTKPYAAYLDQDYLAAPVTGMVDRLPWSRVWGFPAADSPQGLLFARNRALSEQRLDLVRHVTPEECGYHDAAGLYTAHDIYIYRVPSFTTVSLGAPDFSGGRPIAPEANRAARRALEQGVSATASCALPAGTYDVFVTAAGHPDSAGQPVRLDLRLDGKESLPVEVLLPLSETYIAGTVRLNVPRDATIQATVATPGRVELESLTLVRVEEP